MARSALNILIVEDDAGDALLEEIALGQQLFQAQVHYLTTGSEALAYLEGSPPYVDADPIDLILLDGMLKAESGLEVLCRIKKSPSASEIPLVIVTGSERERDRESYLANGADAVLYKRAEFDDLVAELGSLKRFL
jgi:CheY-like chemotaxis protein